MSSATGIFEHDQSFIKLSSPDVQLSERVLEADVISFTFNEEMGKLDTGSLSIRDPEHIYSRILRVGARIFISWGYLREAVAEIQGIDRLWNATEITGSLARRGVKAYIQSPSGSADENGNVFFNCNFISMEQRGEAFKEPFESGSYKEIISQVMDKIGITKKYIDFERGNDKATAETPIIPKESPFQFLTRKARDWRCSFKVGWTQDGELVGLFTNPEKATLTMFKNDVTGGAGLSNYFDYRTTLGNVISYEWKNRQGESGVGAGANLTMVNGQIRIQRYVVEEEKVKTWRLDPEKIKAVLETAEAEGGTTDAVQLVQEYLKENDWEAFKKFFDPVENETAPQGFGYTVNLKSIGNPLVTVGNLAQFGIGFPDFIGRSKGTKDILFYVDRVVHKLGREGYTNDIEIVDQYAISPTGELY